MDSHERGASDDVRDRGLSESARLAESEALLEAIYAMAPVGLAFLDEHFRFVRINAALAETNGLPIEAHLGRTPRELLPGVPMESIEACWATIMETGRPMVGVEICGEGPAQPGVARCVRQHWYPVRVRGRTVGIGVVSREITEEKRAEQLRAVLAGIVGHDLRSPLAVISLAAQQLMRETEPGDRPRAVGTRIKSAVTRIDGLARDLLDYTVVQRGRALPLHVRETRVEEILEAAVQELQAVRPGAIIRCTGQGDGHVTWDPDRVRQLVENLLANAIKYGSPDQPIAAAWSGEADEVVLEVENQGPPIPPEHLPQVFDVGWQADARRAGGVGLGLFIAREVVRAHGGTIEVRSTPDATVFTARLPRVAVPGANADAAAAQQH